MSVAAKAPVCMCIRLLGEEGRGRDGGEGEERARRTYTVTYILLLWWYCPNTIV